MSDQDAITKTVRAYIDGGRTGDANIMRPAFFDNATIYSISDGQLQGGPIEGLFNAVEQMGPAPDLVDNIANIDVNDNTAAVRLELDNWAGARFTDQLTLMKVAGAWKILHKVYVRH